MASGPMVPHSFPGLLIYSFKDLYSTSSRKLLRGAPDSSTVKKNSFGRYMAWDTTVVHTCAASYLSQTAISAGSAAEQAAVRKTAKYALPPATHLFVPIAFRTLGPVNAEGAEVLSEVGRRISSVSGDQRETKFLLQRLSICVQRHNASAFRGLFRDGREAWDEA